MSRTNVIDLADRRPRPAEPAPLGIDSERVTDLALQAVHLPTTLSRSEIAILGAAILAHAGARRDVM